MAHEPPHPDAGPADELLRGVIDSAPVGTWINFQDRIVYINRAGLAILGARNESEIIGKSPFDLIHPDYHNRVRERIAATLAQGQPGPAQEEVFFRVDGEPVVVAVSAYSIPYAGSRAARVSFQSVDQLEVHERRLLEGVRRFRSILETVRAIGLMLDAGGRITFANTFFLELSGYRENDVIGRDWFDLFTPGNEPLRKAFTEAIAAGRIFSHSEHTITIRSGERRLIAWDNTILRGADGAVQGTASIGRDITVERAIQDDLNESEERFRATFENAAVGMAHIAPDGTWLRVNRKLCEILGYTREQLLGKRFQDITHPDDLVANLVALGRLLSGEISTYSTEKRYLREGAEPVWVHLTVSLLRNRDGSPSACISVMEDITERRRVENTLRADEERFRLLADSVAQLVWMADHTGSVYWYNRRWYEYTGTTPEEMAAGGWWKVQHPEMVSVVAERWRASVASGSEFEMTFPLRGRDGVYRPFLTRAVPTRDASGAVLGWMGTNTDVTEQKRAEDLLKRSNEDLQQFAYVASHDLREPLGTISTFTKVLQRRLAGALTPENERDLEFIAGAARRMSALIDALLSYSRVSRDELRSYSRVDLNDAAAGAIENLRAAVAASGARIVVEPLPAVFGDAAQLGQVFQNLVSNSLRYRKPDVCPEIVIRAMRREQVWQLSVADNGQGFPPEYNEAVFAVFRRLHGQETPGTGIGLAICRTVIERHGGRIWADGRPDQGTTIHFTLPAGVEPVSHQGP